MSGNRLQTLKIYLKNESFLCDLGFFRFSSLMYSFGYFSVYMIFSKTFDCTKESVEFRFLLAQSSKNVYAFRTLNQCYVSFVTSNYYCLFVLYILLMLTLILESDSFLLPTNLVVLRVKCIDRVLSRCFDMSASAQMILRKRPIK